MRPHAVNPTDAAPPDDPLCAAPAPAPLPTLAPGAMLGVYRVMRLVGAGGMAMVYEGEHTGLKKRVAIKTLLPRVAADAALRARFLNEGETAARIRHPHVVDVTDVGTHDGVPFLVMEYLEGEDLAARLERLGPLSVEQTVDVMVPVLAAVTAAHEAGVIHRDLKPENIFLVRALDGGVHPKVVDFGVSKLCTPSGRRRTTAGVLLGTLEYMAPEQVLDGREVDARADQYALGVIMYECTTGRRPHSADTVLELLRCVAEGRVVPPREVRGSLPDLFECVVLRAMDRDPAARFDSVRSLAKAVLPFASERTRVAWSAVLGASVRPPAPASAGVTASPLPPVPAPPRTPRATTPFGAVHPAPARVSASGPVVSISPAEQDASSPEANVPPARRASDAPRGERTNTLAGSERRVRAPSGLVAHRRDAEARWLRVAALGALVAGATLAGVGLLRRPRAVAAAAPASLVAASRPHLVAEQPARAPTEAPSPLSPPQVRPGPSAVVEEARLAAPAPRAAIAPAPRRAVVPEHRATSVRPPASSVARRVAAPARANTHAAPARAPATSTSPAVPPRHHAPILY